MHAQVEGEAYQPEKLWVEPSQTFMKGLTGATGVDRWYLQVQMEQLCEALYAAPTDLPHHFQ